MFESLSKQEIIKEYGNSFAGDLKFITSNVIEKFGDHNVKNIYAFKEKEIALSKNIEYEKAIKEDIIQYYKRQYDIYKPIWLSKFIFRDEIKDFQERIKRNQSDKDSIEKNTKIILLPDAEYLLPKERLHNGDTIFICSFDGLSMDILSYKVIATLIDVVDNKLEMHYRCCHNDKEYDVFYDNRGFYFDAKDKLMVYKTYNSALNNIEILMNKKISIMHSNFSRLNR